MRARLVLGLLAAVAIPAALAADRTSGTWLVPTRVSRPISTMYGLEVVAAANGDAVAVWVEVDSATPRAPRVVKSAIRPAGHAWQAPRSLTPPGPETGFPDVAVDANGKAVAAWTASVGSQGVVQASVRPPGGRFGSPLTVAQTAQNVASSFGPPKVAFGPKGDAIVVWAGGNTYGSPIVQFAALTSGRFGAPRKLASGSSPDVAVDGRGGATVVWVGSRGVEAAVRPAGGRFGTPRLLGVGDRQPVIAVDARGDAVVAWGVWSTAKADIRAAFRRAGRPFGPAETVGPAGDRVVGLEAAIDGSGNAVVLWQSDNYVMFPLQAAFRPFGETFAGSRVLSPDAGGFGVAANPRGDATAVWSRYAGDFRAQVATLERGRTRFGAPRDLSEPGYNAMYPAVAVDAAGNVVASWAGSEGRSVVIEAAGYDAAGPQLRTLSAPTDGKIGQRLRFSVRPLDVWSRVAATRWSFGDGGRAIGTHVSHAYPRAGRYTVRVTASDSLGHETSATRRVRITR